MNRKWDRRMMGLAKYIATEWGQDPSTRCGAVVARGKNLIALGYNGFPPGVDDAPDRLLARDTRLAMTLHAEVNALLMAGAAAQGATLYVWPMPPCSQCAAVAIRAGVARVVAPEASPERMERWGDQFDLAMTMYREANVIADLWFDDPPNRVLGRCCGGCGHGES